MDAVESSSADGPRTSHKIEGLSYKFQRLRERLRNAVTNGELSGKLPGERALARRFHVNAKTLSKALTDLAAEGLLDRSIGRGTYVKDTAAPGEGAKNGTKSAKSGRWLIVSDAQPATAALVALLRQANPEATVIEEISALRPSFLRQFSAVVDLAANTPESFLRDLVVRNIPVVAVNREPNLYSINTVGTDRALGANHLTRDLILGGHSRIAVVESTPRSVVARAVKAAAARYGPQASVRISRSDEVLAAVREGVTAIISDSVLAARDIRTQLETAGVRIPQDVSLSAIDCCTDGHPCSGQYVDSAATARTVAELMAGPGNAHRPTTIWLAPAWVDCGTTRSAPDETDDAADKVA
jgi:hypothetical protein